MPHFKTKGGKSFSFDEIADAFAYLEARTVEKPSLSLNAKSELI